MTVPEQLIGEAPHVGRRIGRYLILDEIASGGMATVHLAHVMDGPASEGPPKFVAAKCMHAHYARDPDFVSMFTDEATLCTLIRHENVVATIDVTQGSEELLLVLELVEGESLSKLVKSIQARKARVPQAIASAIVGDLLRGLHAAHEAKNADGEQLFIVHRDVSPHNVLVATDGIARVLDFGVAKARGRVQQTQKGQLKGKLAYMSPEQARGRTVDRRSDVFSAGIVLWELLTGQRLLDGENEAALLVALLSEKPAPPSSKDPVLARFDALVQKALEVEPDARYATALEMADAVERAISPASRAEVAAWVKTEAKSSIERRHMMIERAGARVKSILGGAPATPSLTPLPASNAPESGTIEKDEPVAVIDLGWSIAPKPAEPAAASTPSPAPAEVRSDAPTVPAALPPQIPKPPGSAQGAVGPGGPLRPRIEPRIVEPRRSGALPIARPPLKPISPLGLRPAVKDAKAVPSGRAESDPLWDTSTTTDDDPPTSVEPRQKLALGAPIAPSPTQVLPAASAAEIDSIRDATLPLYQPPAAYLEAAGIGLDRPGATTSVTNMMPASPSSQGAGNTMPLAAQPMHGIPPNPAVPSRPMAPPQASIPASQNPSPSGSGDWSPMMRTASMSDGFQNAARAIPTPPSSVPGGASPPSNPGAEGVSSQVSSVNLTTLDIPPPLPDVTIRKLQVVAVVSGLLATIACIALLIILTRKPWAEPVAPSATPTTLPDSLPDRTAVPPPAPAPTPIPMPEPAASEPVVPSASVTTTASASAPAATSTQVAQPPSSPTQTSAPTPKPGGFLGRPTSQTGKPKPPKK